MDQWTAKLDVYLDGELPAAEMQAVQEHVRECPDCATEALSRVQMKRAIHSSGRRYQASDEFRQRVRKQAAPRAQRSHVRIWVPIASFAILLLFVSLTVISVQQRQFASQSVFSEIADLHVSTLASANPVDVVSTDRHTVKPWFQGKLPFTFNLPELQNSDFTLMGARVSYLEQSPGAELIYQIRKHEISVFIFQEQPFQNRIHADSLQRRESFNVGTWSENGLRYFVIGDASAGDIQNLASLLKHAAREWLRRRSTSCPNKLRQ